MIDILADKKHCPFCGTYACTEENDYVIGNTDYTVRCANLVCPVRPYVRRKTKEEAIAAWNTRFNPF